MSNNSRRERYDYANDALGRRTMMGRTGTAYGNDPDAVTYGYNVRSEVTNALAATDLAYRYAYAFDDIGNRDTAAERGTNFTYSANSLNQYTNILCASTSLRFIPAFDLDGNQTLIRTSTGVWTVTYNGENRPVSWTCGVTNIAMAFDRMGRRVVCDMSVSGSLAESKRFSYDGYLLVQESNLATSNQPQATSQSYVWDPTEPAATKPLATSHQPQATSYYYIHDGNKNVSALVAAQPAQPALLASYVYAPFGAVTSSSGTLATVNPFRFSSEYADDALSLVYYNYRHYNPTDGRWCRADPLSNGDGIVLLCFVHNNSISSTDRLGLQENYVTDGHVYYPGTPSYPYLDGSRYPPCPEGAKVTDALSGGLALYRTKRSKSKEIKTNGCGAENGAAYPNSYMNIVDFRECCNNHDKCYGTCNAKKDGCDRRLGDCMCRQCDEKLNWAFIERALCRSMAGSYEFAVRFFGETAYESAQDEYCEWEPCCSKKKEGQ